MDVNEAFDNFAIAKIDDGEFLKHHQGQYPVIFITFKDSKEPSFESSVNQLRDLIQKLYREHEKLLNSEKLSVSDKTLFQEYLGGSVNNEKLQSAIAFLSEFLYKVYEKKAIILIDEYDTPITNAYQQNFLESLTILCVTCSAPHSKAIPFLKKD